MDYQGYKLLDKIMLVCRDKATYENSHGVNESSCYQAYLVDVSTLMKYLPIWVVMRLQNYLNF